MDLDETSARETARQIGDAGGRAAGYAADVSRAPELDRAVGAAVAALGPLEVMVNNAGILDGYFDVDEMDEALWRKVIDIDLTGVFLGCKRALREMLPRKRGRIVNMASVAGLSGGSPDMATVAYNTSKAAVINCTRSLAAEWGKYNINVNAICPGFFPSKMSRGVLEKIQESVIARTPLHRLGGDEDLKGVAVFLASAASRHITGQYIAVDGGACIT